ncbi:alkaline phytoceramidase-like protein [Coleophoma crateriformis]|uniref:Alkaline phytoceramidase-like protein n=1 Tax=Coleophoma crateriformis TaxID=565419 RepID=A0A3D8RDA4_9HELO|nr:alkaline phytoceramidase-like protein [Coleophoma crateriformis]
MPLQSWQLWLSSGVNIRPSLRAKFATSQKKLGDDPSIAPSQRAANARRDKQILKDMWLMVALGLFVFLGGFGIWNLDNHYCSTLRSWRKQVGLPWGILLEGHGWWHLMTGTGAYFYIIWGIWLRHCLNDRQEEFVLHWPSIFTSLPEIVPASTLVPQAQASMANGKFANGINGSSKAEHRKSM